MKIPLFIVVLLFFPIYSFSFENSMIVGNIELRLGTPKDEVVDTFIKNNYDVSATNETYVITKKKDDLNDFIGSVSFTNNKLSFISTRWFYSDTDKGSFELAEKIFDLLKKETPDGKSITPVVKVNSIVQPSVKIDSIDIVIDNKTISIADTKGKEFGHQISVFEAIRTK